MTMKNDNNLMTYVVKKNHMQIYTEFLNFQPVATLPNNSQTNVFQSINSKNEKQINLRNFKALYWIALYLKEIKGHSLILVYEFFSHKKWTTWQFKNFSYHYHKLIKLERVQQEIQQINTLIRLEEDYPSEQINTPVTKEPTQKISKEKSEPHKPIQLGSAQQTNDLSIRPNCSPAESLEQLRLLKEKALSKINNQ